MVLKPRDRRATHAGESIRADEPQRRGLLHHRGLKHFWKRICMQAAREAHSADLQNMSFTVDSA